ncbi:MAG: hypothetical protein FWH53_01030 [Leptospirales bacterium]|nr:hypothetical protein [Leptospirales bacterium]
MKTKIALLIGLFGFFMTALTSCYNSDREKEATLIINLGATRIQAALETWPPSNADLSKLEYEVKLSGPIEITEKVSGGSGPIILSAIPGYYVISVTAYSDGVLYARGITDATVRSGQNNIPITMHRAGIYEIEVAVLPDEKYIQKGDSFTFDAKSFYGPALIEVSDEYKWSLSGNTLPETKINEATGELFVASSEPADDLTVTAESKTYSSKYGTANVILINPNIPLVHAKEPFISGQPQDATYTINGAAIALTVTADVDDDGTLSYQWYSNSTNSISGGTEISGAINANYTPSTSALGTIYYYAVVTNTNNSVNGDKIDTTVSDTAAVTVNALVNAVPPKITDQPISASYVQNAPATKLTVTAESTDGGALSYQWYSNSSNSNSGGISLGAINGAQTKGYTPGTDAAGISYYYCEITNTITNNGDGGIKTATVTSNVVSVTVTLPFVAVTGITGVPTSVTAENSLTLTETVVPSNATYKTIVWSIIDDRGPTNASITGNILNTISAAGTVTVRATIANGTAIGTDYIQDFTITVEPLPEWVVMVGSNGFITLESAIASITSGTATVTVLKDIPSQNPIPIISATKTINLVSEGAKEIQLGTSGSLITVNSGVTLRIGDSSSEIGGASSGELTLRGINSNNVSLITVSNGGALELYNNAIITGNTNNSNSGGGGVYVNSGTFTISGGEISENTVDSTVQEAVGGGGVYAVDSIILMTSGAIKDNYVTNVYSGDTHARGGGISIGNNTNFEMTGGFIEDNIVNDSSTNALGGTGGGGVAIQGNNSTFFYFKGGTIRNNTCQAQSVNTFGVSDGGGVSIRNQGNFIMSGGVINGNTITHSINPNKSYGTGGMYADGAYGGGFYSTSLGVFVKTGGVIYGGEAIGNDADGIPLKNTAQSDAGGLGGGHAVFFENGLGILDKLYRNSTSEETDDMDSSISGSGGGWE